MKKRIITILMTCTMLSLLSACGVGKPQTMTLSLDSNPTTGYSWTVSQEPELLSITEEYKENAHEDGMVGVGGQQIFTLTPKDAGTTSVTFVYARPWEDPENTETEVSYTVEISKSMRIKVTGTAFGGGNDINTLPEVPEPVIQ